MFTYGVYHRGKSIDYTMEEHKHRFSAWAACRAASVIRCRFTVEDGKKIIESSMLRDLAKDIKHLPSPDDFDLFHRKLRKDIIRSAKALNITFTHGVAAKLINMYLKSIYVCGGNHIDIKVKSIHPPIDSVLLNDLYRQDVGGKRLAWRKAREAKWSKFSSSEYEAVILAIQQSVPVGEGLWKIEEFWQGFQ